MNGLTHGVDAVLMRGVSMRNTILSLIHHIVYQYSEYSCMVCMVRLDMVAMLEKGK